MYCVKFNGFLQEIFETPDADLVAFFQSKLFLPLDKAEALACRIKKERLQTVDDDIVQKRIYLVAEKIVDVKQSKTVVYNFESLSDKEFKLFIKWFLIELGYSITAEITFAMSCVTFIVVKDGLKTAVLTHKYCGDCVISDATVLLAQQEKIVHQCEHTIVLATAVFSEQAKLDAEKQGIELWDAQKICEKIMEINKRKELTVQAALPKYACSLFDSLTSLTEHKMFLVEKRAGGKHDLFFPGVKFPILTFQVQKGIVTRLVFRVKYNEPVGESTGEILIRYDRAGNRFGPEDIEAYTRVVEYLEQFLN